jgi:ribosomal protein S18 acetylase RimI-like enzyme
MFTIASYSDSDFGGVDTLWREAFPDDSAWNSADVSIPEKLKLQPDLLLVAVDPIMAGYDGHRGWISRVAVLRSGRRQGVGVALVREAEKRLFALGCRKVNLQVVTSNAGVLDFYRTLGYQVEERISMGKHLAKSGSDIG